jgi:hypothetical protein
MHIDEMNPVLTKLWSELVDGPRVKGEAFVLNSGDIGLLRSLDKLSYDAASRSVNDGATIAAHAQHLRYGLSLMNRWASEGGNPFAVAHLAYHLGAIRQIDQRTRGPKEGTFT